MDEEIAFCRMPEQIVMDAVCAWPDGNITWTAMDSLPGMTDDAFLQNLGLGFDWWKPYCGVKPSYVESASQARILVYVRKLDGPSGVLAQCELPCGNIKQVKMTLDVGETWLSELSPTQRGILLRLVVAHEGGHGYGMGHAPAGSMNIMAPIYNPKIIGAGTWDVEQSVSRYGLPVPIPPPPIPPPTGTNKLIIEYEGQIKNAKIIPPLNVTPTSIPSPGGSVMNPSVLKSIRALLDLAGMVTAMTPNTIDDQVVNFLKKFLDSILAGNQPTQEQLAQLHQVLNLQA